MCVRLWVKADTTHVDSISIFLNSLASRVSHLRAAAGYSLLYDAASKKVWNLPSLYCIHSILSLPLSSSHRRHPSIHRLDYWVTWQILIRTRAFGAPCANSAAVSITACVQQRTVETKKSDLWVFNNGRKPRISLSNDERQVSTRVSMFQLRNESPNVARSAMRAPGLAFPPPSCSLVL